jgi:hypothetical protein
MRGELVRAGVRVQAMEEKAQAAAAAAASLQTQHAKEIAELAVRLTAKEKQLDAILSTMGKRSGGRRSDPPAAAQ